MIRILFLAFLVMCPVLSGCAKHWRTETPAPQAAAPAAPAASPLVAFVSTRQIGESAKIQDAEFGNVTVFVEDSYVSALGEQCIKARVQMTRDCSEVVAVCKRDGLWVKMPSIWRSCFPAAPVAAY